MKKTILFLCSTILLLTATTGNAQQQEKTYKSYSNSLTVNLTRFILNEARVGYERNLAEHHVARIVLGFQYPTSSTSFNTIPVGLGYVPNYYKVSKGIYTGIGYNYMFGKHLSAYVSGEIYYSYSYYNDKYYHYCVGHGGDSFVALQSMNLNKTGLKILIGKKVRIVSCGKAGLELDIFAGAGVQYRHEALTIFERRYGGCNYDYSDLYKLDPPEKHNYINWYPTLHLGVSACVPFL